MKPSRELRLLQNKWNSGNHWPKRLEWLEIHGLRGWTGHRIDFKFPIVAISGENGSGKSSIIQAAASIYSSPAGKGLYASDFFPDTAWEKVRNASIRYGVRQGESAMAPNSVRKPGPRWRGLSSRPVRDVAYADLSRTQPVSTRVGYARLAKSKAAEASFTSFDSNKTARLSNIMGRTYGSARMAITNLDKTREVPVLSIGGRDMSGYHLGAGELTMAEFLAIDPPKYSLLLIDEIETSLHPRAQRRLIRDLADLCRERELQIILTTHSPFVLEELPPQARGYILLNNDKKEVVFGVSPQFAMTKMDAEQHPECDLYVEDERAAVLLREALIKLDPQSISRIQPVAYGAAGVGKALGIMVSQNRFKSPSLVFLDGDQTASVGCLLLPGQDAPEHIVFEALANRNWCALHTRIGRDFSDVADHCARSMTATDHHEWVASAANQLLLSTDVLWQAMCAEWANSCLIPNEWTEIVKAISAILPE